MGWCPSSRAHPRSRLPASAPNCSRFRFSWTSIPEIHSGTCQPDNFCGSGVRVACTPGKGVQGHDSTIGKPVRMSLRLLADRRRQQTTYRHPVWERQEIMIE
eukprot:4938187-Pyramimonas_sp.AAC.1